MLKEWVRLPLVKLVVSEWSLAKGFKVAKLFVGVSTFWVSVPDVVNDLLLPLLSKSKLPEFSNFKKKPLFP